MSLDHLLTRFLLVRLLPKALALAALLFANGIVLAQGNSGGVVVGQIAESAGPLRFEFGEARRGQTQDGKNYIDVPVIPMPKPHSLEFQPYLERTEPAMPELGSGARLRVFRQGNGQSVLRIEGDEAVARVQRLTLSLRWIGGGKQQSFDLASAGSASVSATPALPRGPSVALPDPAPVAGPTIVLPNVAPPVMPVPRSSIPPVPDLAPVTAEVPPAPLLPVPEPVPGPFVSAAPVPFTPVPSPAPILQGVDAGEESSAGPQVAGVTPNATNQESSGAEGSLVQPGAKLTEPKRQRPKAQSVRVVKAKPLKSLGTEKALASPKKERETGDRLVLRGKRRGNLTSQEMSVANKMALDEANDRISALTSQVDKLKELLKLKDQAIADKTKELAAIRSGKPSNGTVATAAPPAPTSNLLPTINLPRQGGGAIPGDSASKQASQVLATADKPQAAAAPMVSPVIPQAKAVDSDVSKAKPMLRPTVTPPVPALDWRDYLIWGVLFFGALLLAALTWLFFKRRANTQAYKRHSADDDFDSEVAVRH